MTTDRNAASGRTAVGLVGSSDIAARIDLVRALGDQFDFTLVGSAPQADDTLLKSGIRYRSYPLNRGANPLADARALISLYGIFREEGFRIVHAFDTKPSVLARLAAKLARVPVIIGTLPGLGSLYIDDDGSLKTRLVRAVYELAQKAACRVSDLTVFQNSDDARQFVARGVAPRQCVRVIPGSGIRTDVFCVDKVSADALAALRAELGLPANHTVVTMVSRLIRSKGVLDFLEVAERLGPQHEVSFVLVGPLDSLSLDRLNDDEIQRLAASKYVIWTGNRKDVSCMLALSDVFVLPSYYREGIPRVLLEAAAMGLPLITTDSPGCREAVQDHVNGFLVPPRDVAALGQAIARLLADPELRGRFGGRSRSLAVERFDLSIVTGKTASMYRELLRGKTKAGLPTVGLEAVADGARRPSQPHSALQD